jgi:oligopeptide transport system substrate-binding protein
MSRYRPGRSNYRLFLLITVAALAASTIQLTPIHAAPGGGSVVLTSAMRQDTEPITRYDSNTWLISTLDPQKVEDAVSVTPVENLFLGLTDIDPKTSEPRPEVAIKWEQNAGGDVWVFTLRSDIPWVRWDPRSNKATEIRKVVAADFEYGIKRACDPRLEAYYTKVAAAMIKGCDTVAKLNAKTIQDSDFDQIGVRALSDTQLEITTQGRLSYFLSASAMWMLRAVPKEVIAEYGDRWTDPAVIVTNGPFVIDSFVRNRQQIYVRNPLYPKDVNEEYGGNVERVISIVVRDVQTMYSLYGQNLLDVAVIPVSDYQKTTNDPELSKQIVQPDIQVTFYFGFMYDKPPFDKVGVRRAFSAVIDRKAFVQDVLNGRGTPAAHFMPPGVPGAAPSNEIGLGSADNLGFDPEYARKQLAEAGYPDCKGFPSFTVLDVNMRWIRFLRDSIQTHLGCDPGLIRAQLTDFDILLKRIKPTSAARPNMFSIGWQGDYPDPQNWMHNVLSCNAQNDFKRPCNPDLDGKIDLAAKETDPQKRNLLYRELEEAFFGENGEFPIIPLFNGTEPFMVKPWYTGAFTTDARFGGEHWNTYVIDAEAQRAARRGEQSKQ